MVELRPKMRTLFEQAFYKLFRERRRQARRLGQPFPSYLQAKAQLIAAFQIARWRGDDAIDIDEFWSDVFAT